MGQGTPTIFTDRRGSPPRGSPRVVIAEGHGQGAEQWSHGGVADRDGHAGSSSRRATTFARARARSEATGDELRRAILGWHAGNPGAELGRAEYKPPPGVHWDDTAYRGDAYAAYGWATYVAEVEVDLRTWWMRVIDFVALQDVGTVLHPRSRACRSGRGGSGIGWALMEECRWEDGAMSNGQLTNYIVPTFDDLPPIRVFFDETAWPRAARRQGLGELPIDGPAPALRQRDRSAVGAFRRRSR